MLRLFDPWSNFEHVQNLSRMVKDVQVLLRMITDAIRKSTDEYGLPRMMPDQAYPWLILRPIRECETCALAKCTDTGEMSRLGLHCLPMYAFRGFQYTFDSCPACGCVPCQVLSIKTVWSQTRPDQA